MLRKTAHIEGWIIDLTTDDDGHLAIGVNHEDGSKIHPIEEDLSTNDIEWVERFTTAKIETNYIASRIMTKI